MTTQQEVTGTLAAAASEVVVSGKKFWASKTFWVNILAAAGMIAQMHWGFVVSPELQAMALTLVNLVLRKVTREPVTW